MKAVKQTIGLMLTHSVAMFISVILITAIFAFFQYDLSLYRDASNFNFMPAVMISLTLSVLLGVYLGGGMKSLQQNYLWKINQRYRNVLMAAFLIIATVYSLILVPTLYLNTQKLSLLFLLPFCITIFSSHMIIGQNLFHKILIPAVPFGLYQLIRFGVGLTPIIIVLILATCSLIFAMYNNYFSFEQSQIKQTKEDAMAVATTGLNLKWVMAFNYHLGLIIAKWIARSKRNIDWTIIMPHTKLALFSLLYVILIMGFVLMNSDKGDKPLLEGFTIMFISASFIGLIMESRQLLRQTRVFAHVFSGDKHRQLRNKILLSMDKMFIINSIVFVVGIFLVAFAFSKPVNAQYILYTVTAVILFALSYYPILLCMNWINISFTLLASIIVYAGIIFATARWIKAHPIELLSSPYTWMFVAACLLLRGITQYIFWQRPFEALLKNK